MITLTLQLTSGEERAFNFFPHATGRLKNKEKSQLVLKIKYTQGVLSGRAFRRGPKVFEAPR